MNNFFIRILLFMSLVIFDSVTFAQQTQPQPPLPKSAVKQDSINSYKPAMIDNAELNRIFVGSDNLFHYRGIGSRKLIGKMGEKVIEQKDGFFIIHVVKAGTYILSIYDAATSTLKLIEEKKFEAVDMPDPFASIAGKSSGFISKKELQLGDSLSVKSKKQTGNRIMSFKMVLINGKIGRAEYESKDGKLTNQMKAGIARAAEGTTVFFEYIRALVRVRGAGVSVNLPAISFILEN